MHIIKDARMTVVLRFCYVFDRRPHAPYGDTTKTWVLKHIEQLSPLLHEFRDLIDTVQAGFIGTWGEWYFTTYFGQPDKRNHTAYPHTFGFSPQIVEDRRQVLEALIDAVPIGIQVQQRHPWWNRMIFGPDPPTRDDVVRHTYKGRTGYHDDCFLANKLDQGTYMDGVKVDYPYVHEQTKYLVAGGETCEWSPTDPGRHNCSVALKEMAYFHWTYLNIGFYIPVLTDWQTQGCFNDIFRNMGYRFVLKESILPTVAHTGSDICVRIVFRNRGYAAPIRNWDISIVFRRGSDHLAVRLRKRDMSLWQPGSDIVIDENLHVPADLQPGTYEVMMGSMCRGEEAFRTFLVFSDPNFPDKSDYNILMANKGVPEHKNGVNNLRHQILLV
ncbi:uncharacterized protein LOC135464453 [Liolophura sinensis]|uniref:uncharacterized protein LOC135464453 n=1 Tax=Liolophura sinensis TaxID=3198878 RepID=UPI003157F687